MILFTMKILGYAAGCYSVEYIPNNTRCSPIKLNIQLDNSILNNSEFVLDKLKASSPQDYWLKQLAAQNSSNASIVASQLINTSHVVREPVTLPVNPVTAFVQPTQSYPQFNYETPPPPPPPQSTAGQSTPEQQASPEDQNVIKLKILIQQVLQEMAEGTV
jgi:hypothetical protein